MGELCSIFIYIEILFLTCNVTWNMGIYNQEKEKKYKRILKRNKK